MPAARTKQKFKIAVKVVYAVGRRGRAAGGLGQDEGALQDGLRMQGKRARAPHGGQPAAVHGRPDVGFQRGGVPADAAFTGVAKGWDGLIPNVTGDAEFRGRGLNGLFLRRDARVADEPTAWRDRYIQMIDSATACCDGADFLGFVTNLAIEGSARRFGMFGRGAARQSYGSGKNSDLKRFHHPLDTA